MSLDQYSKTASSNDLTGYFKTGMRPSQVKTAGWDIMADLAQLFNALPAGGGTANAQTLTNTVALQSLTDGLTVIYLPTAANTGPATFAPDGLTAESIFANGAALAGGEMQANVPALLKYRLSVTAWELLNPLPPGKNFMVDPCCRVAQIGTSSPPSLTTSYKYGVVDLIQAKGAGSAVSAGTITQDSSTTVSSGATPYSCKLAGVTITGTGKVYLRRFIESRDSQAFNGKTVLFSVKCRHDVGSNINAFLTVNKFASVDSSGSNTLLATGSTVSVASATDTVVNVAYTFGSSDGANGIEIILEMDCGAVTTKNFYATDWQVAITTLAQTCVVPEFARDLYDAMRYYEQTYDYGTSPGTATTQGQVALAVIFGTWNTGTTNGGSERVRFNAAKFLAPTIIYYSPNNGASGNCYELGAAANKAIATGSISTKEMSIINNSGGSWTNSNCPAFHYTADSRP